MKDNVILQFETVIKGLKNGEVFTHRRLNELRSRFIKLKYGYFIQQKKYNGMCNLKNMDDSLLLLLKYSLSGCGGLPFVITNEIFLEPEGWEMVTVYDFKKYCPKDISNEKKKVLKKNFKKLFN